ncbi:hypothetical protein [Natronococcus wangiae]|uniref:hypothetical protein n=1 Tax=Natronococcus wangiae TaxID=3068275 RepID=UPI00273F6046|nr:hypothetical protein [Natronococcus sp. AD5]
MSLLTTGGIVASIVPFDPTFGIAVVATAMLSLFVLVMVFPAVAPLVSSTWAEPRESAASGGFSLEANGGEVSERKADENEADGGEIGEGETGAGSAALHRDEVGDDMTGTFTNDEIGKLVERADGKVIGTVASVDGETAHVEPAPDALDQILIRLGRKEMGDSFDLDADSVREISDTRVHLERDFSELAARPTDSNEDSVSSAKQ